MFRIINRFSFALSGPPKAKWLSTASCNTAANLFDRKMGPVEETVQRKLKENFSPSHLEVINESSMHNVPKGSETHFKVVVVSERFEEVPLIQRHRLINDTLKDELSSGIHALSIVAKTPKQWDEIGCKVDKSPPCLGGSGR